MSKEKRIKTKRPFDFDQFWGFWNLVEAAIVLVAGVFGIVFGIQSLGKDSGMDGGWIQAILPFMVGAFVAMDAVLRIITVFYKKEKQTDESVMLTSGFELTAAIVVMIMHDQFTRLMIYGVAVLLIVIGALLITFSVFAIIRRSKKLFVPVFEIVFAAVLVAVGIAVLVLYSTANNNGIVLLIAGIVFCLASIAWGVIAIVNMVKASKKRPIENQPSPSVPAEEQTNVMEPAYIEHKEDGNDHPVITAEEVDKK